MDNLRIKDVIDVLVEPTDKILDLGKEETAKIGLKYKPKIKEIVFKGFKRIKNVFSRKTTEKPNISSVFEALKTEKRITTAEEISSVTVAPLTQMKDMAEMAKENLGLNSQQIPVQKETLSKNSYSIKEYLAFVFETIVFHLLFIQQKPLLYAYTYPVQAIILLGIFGSVIGLSVSKLAQLLFSTPTKLQSEESDSKFLQEEEFPFFTEEQIIANQEGECRILKEERDCTLGQLQRQDSQRIMVKKDYFQIGPTQAEGVPFKDTVEFVKDVVTIVKDYANEPNVIQTTDQSIDHILNMVHDCNEKAQLCQDQLVSILKEANLEGRTALKECQSGGINNCTQEVALTEKNMQIECTKQTAEITEKVTIELVEQQVNKICSKDTQTIKNLEGLVQSNMCTDKPSACIEHIQKMIVPGMEAKKLSFFQKVKNLFH